MVTSSSPIEHGYLLLADISGYTTFLSETELDHAQEILTYLLETILSRFKTLLTICKLEGDAVFAYAAESRVIRGETLIELIETTYADFRERAENIRRRTTCQCRACRSIPMLDLKFIVHHGDFVVQNIAGVRELAGSDVNLAHRLLKNHVTEATGWQAYALFTEQALECIGVRPNGLREGIEAYEHLGEAKIYSMDLRSRYEALMANRRVVVEPGQALISFTLDYDAPPPVVWSWLNEPQKRHLYSVARGELMFKPIARPGGRTGVGATTHCIHGKDVAMYETILDWRPFDYFTVEQDIGMLGVFRATATLESKQEDKTRLQLYINGYIPRLPGFLSRLLIRLISRFFNYRKVFENMRLVMGDAQAQEGSAAEAVPDPVSA